MHCLDYQRAFAFGMEKCRANPVMAVICPAEASWDGEMSQLATRHAVITGGGSGIGLAIACRLAADGACVSLMGRNAERLKKAASEIVAAQAIQCDVTDPQSVTAAFAEASDRAPIDILVANAGAAASASFAKLDLDHWRRMLDINLTGAFLCAKQVAPILAKADYGRIIMIASTAGQKGYGYVAAYVAAKHGVIGLTRALAAEYAGTNLTVNAICPGFADTELLGKSLDEIVSKTGRTRGEALAQIIKNNPQRRLIEPDEVAEAAAWLCAQPSRSITGQSVSVSGGEYM